MRKRIGIGLFVSMLVALGTQEASAQQRAGQIIPPASLTDAEKDWITRIRIDEKLARDVYQELYTVWGVPIFANIALSEQNHMDAVGTLIRKYGLSDPVAGLGAGEFPDEFQGLYDTLISDGSQSVVGAYCVGVIIETLDIADLTAALDDKTEVTKRDICTVFEKLLAGSQNHLAAFLSHL